MLLSINLWWLNNQVDLMLPWDFIAHMLNIMEAIFGLLQSSLVCSDGWYLTPLSTCGSVYGQMTPINKVMTILTILAIIYSLDFCMDYLHSSEQSSLPYLLQRCLKLFMNQWWVTFYFLHSTNSLIEFHLVEFLIVSQKIWTLLMQVYLSYFLMCLSFCSSLLAIQSSWSWQPLHGLSFLLQFTLFVLLF